MDSGDKEKMLGNKRLLPAEIKAGRRVRQVMKRRKKQDAVPNAWRLIDTEFAELHKVIDFTIEACCDVHGFNSHLESP